MSNTELKNKSGEQRRGTARRKRKSSNGALRAIGRVLLILLETVLLISLGLYGVMFVLAKGPSETARNMFVSSVRETSAIKFLANLYFTPEEIEERSPKLPAAAEAEQLPEAEEEPQVEEPEEQAEAVEVED